MSSKVETDSSLSFTLNLKSRFNLTTNRETFTTFQFRLASFQY